MHAVDTNVLVYAHDPNEPEKRGTALDLIGSIEEGALLWQVACEFLAVARRLEAKGFDAQQAWGEIQRIRRIWAIVYPGWETLERSRLLLEDYSLSFWDALILAACATSGVKRIYTEDFTGYAAVDGVEIINPFRDHQNG